MNKIQGHWSIVLYYSWVRLKFTAPFYSFCMYFICTVVDVGLDFLARDARSILTTVSATAVLMVRHVRTWYRPMHVTVLWDLEVLNGFINTRSEHKPWLLWCCSCVNLLNIWWCNCSTCYNILSLFVRIYNLH